MTDSLLWLIAALAVLTYATRFGGYIILSRFKNIHPRVEAALDAVPAAVIAAIVAPSVILSGAPEIIAAVFAVALSYRFSMLGVVAASTLLVALLRLVI
ncbi:MAG: hypothetical protein COA52_04360 [Hyphomicrobiales bacterium]|nr:AzlD domain-containing protein [Hyphomicrobiales bacterium]PCJ95063.1 MAG: hypothetical protein COA52_04360 [Hyphomicrobiales bacterium]